jgi:hypothetical protein
MAKTLMPVATDYYEIKEINPLTNLIKITDFTSLSTTPTYIPVFYCRKRNNEIVANGDCLASLSNDPFSIHIGDKDYELRTLLA